MRYEDDFFSIITKLESYYEPVKKSSSFFRQVKCGTFPKVDKMGKMDTITFAIAGVAELADALGSGLSSRKGVRVQVPPSAQKNS